MIVSPSRGALKRMTGVMPIGRLALVAVAPRPVIAGRPACRPRHLAHGNKLLGARIAAIGLAFREKLLGGLAVARGARELIDGLAIPIELEPAQAVEDGEDGAFRGARPVGVLDAQQHLAALGSRVEPIEQRRARAADMQIAGGGGGKARDDGGAHGSEIAVIALARTVLHAEDNDLLSCFIESVVDQV